MVDQTRRAVVRPKHVFLAGLGALSFAAGLFASCAHQPGSLDDTESAATSEVADREAANGNASESPTPRLKEGALGTRAKGEEGAMGKASGNAGLGLSGVGEGGGGTSQRRAALHEARDFGMVGSLGAGQGFGSGHGRLGGSHKRYAVRGPLMNPGHATPQWSTENYAAVEETGFSAVSQQPLSTFSADVDTASYSNVRRFLKEGRLPPAGAVRVEEMLNYFGYDYPRPSDGSPFGVHTEVSETPWAKGHKLVQIGIVTEAISKKDTPARNLVFLVDVSGSMSSPDKLPLLKRGLLQLVEELDEKDRVSLVVYAGSSGVVLQPTSGAYKTRIAAAIERLGAGGSTHGSAGIVKAYALAQQSFRKEGINRVILASDGDFNVGVTSDDALVRLIEKKRKTGVFLTVLGFGRGNLKDARMEQLADKGNGNYAYIDSLTEARRVLVEQAGSTLVTVAKDVKFQVEFNPAKVESYRLIGYENRRLAARDFNDDTKDAGELGAGHSVTALYEVVSRRGAPVAGGDVDALKYQRARAPLVTTASSELLTLKIRYKTPQGTTSQKLIVPVKDASVAIEDASESQRFAASVALFGMLLSSSDHRGSATLAQARQLAAGATAADPTRREFISLLDRAGGLGI